MHDWIFVVLVLMVCHLYVVLPRTTGQFLEAPPSPQTYCFGFETRRPNCHSRAENEGEQAPGAVCEPECMEFYRSKASSIYFSSNEISGRHFPPGLTTIY